MDNTTLANSAVKEVKMPRLIDDSNKSKKEIGAELNLALEQIERGECITAEELKEKYSKKYGIEF